ncbi:hypothetical protein C2845_PM01G29830 [Panicum miliaceum]|uniref:Inositol-tetrakisphosphate 1-kinase N-terminal domain-containing protein n=1 Tax=Panicum miliaceum TaxID=4540 RepID=A0A3L6TEK2_PANMI|nr:hypothetical protein C2845_PM01G29830 [Panicum miliaceum]
MVSGGCVGAEVEVDPEAAAAAAERDEAVAPAPARELVVGYALTSKKAKSFLQPKLRGLASQVEAGPVPSDAGLIFQQQLRKDFCLNAN